MVSENWLHFGLRRLGWVTVVYRERDARLLACADGQRVHPRATTDGAGERHSLLRELRVPRRYTLGVVCGAAGRRTAAQRLKVGVGEVAEGTLSEAELTCILGAAPGDDGAAKVAAGITKLHEQDLLELKALYYLNGLADTSPELFALRSMTGGHDREQIAKMLAEKQMKKLYLSQVERILSSDVLQTVYSAKSRAPCSLRRDDGGSTSAVFSALHMRCPPTVELAPFVEDESATLLFCFCCVLV